ncbi:MAG: thioredoxin domain-containing protein [Burkholderiales bacterium]
MSKKNRNHGKSAAPSTAPAPAAAKPRTALFVMAVLAIVIGLGGVAWIALSPKATPRTGTELAALQRPHAATLGNPGAPVHIVEFLDPACETCAQFFPLVKGLMKDHQGYIRLSVRLVPFHRNSDIAVKALEASKLQGKFWDVLERLFATQSKWVVGHQVDADKLWAELRRLDLDVARLEADMASPAVQQSLATDMADAKALKVTATPEYFVNGRGLPEFGYEPLRALVDDEVRKAKRG